MLQKVLITILISISTIIHVIFLFPFAILKLIPVSFLRILFTKIIVTIALNWININSFFMEHLIPTKIEVNYSKQVKLTMQDNYMIICNHQSQVDILVLQYLFNKKIPFIRFFIKKELRYVPFLGLAWWALDFPFVRRYSREKIKKKPKLASADIKMLHRMVEMYCPHKISILNFAEGSRRTTQKIKAEQKKRSYKHLLRPRSAGVSVILSHLRNQISAMLDVTILYPRLNLTLNDYLSGKIEWIQVYVDLVPIQDIPVEENPAVAGFSKKMHSFLTERWKIKDELLEIQKNKKGLQK